VGPRGFGGAWGFVVGCFLVWVWAEAPIRQKTPSKCLFVGTASLPVVSLPLRCVALRHVDFFLLRFGFFLFSSSLDQQFPLVNVGLFQTAGFGSMKLFTKTTFSPRRKLLAGDPPHSALSGHMVGVRATSSPFPSPPQIVKSSLLVLERRKEFIPVSHTGR